MTTERDCETMEVMMAAIDSGEVTTREQWESLCLRLNATDAHRFVVILMRGREWMKG